MENNDTNLAASLYYQVETKCRRCGNFADWCSIKRTEPYIDFLTLVRDEIQFPRLLECNNCGKNTIQDVVSYH